MKKEYLEELTREQMRALNGGSGSMGLPPDTPSEPRPDAPIPPAS